MIRGLILAGLSVVHLVSGHELTGHTVLLQPIVLTNDAGEDVAKANLPEELIDLPFHRWDLDFQILEPIEWARRDFRDGEVDVDIIVKAAKDGGVFRQPGRIANMFFAKKINGKVAPNGLGQQPGWVTFIAQGDDPPAGQDAFMVVHEVTHNLGLAHAVDDAEVPVDIPNVMGDGDFLDRIREDGITRDQAATILKSPLVRETVKCLQGKEARRAYLGESFEAYYSSLNRREVEAMTGKAVAKELSGDAWVKEARKRFENAVMDFTPEEREVVLWMIGEYRQLLVEEFPLLANQPWQVIKVKGNHCAGFCHTRGLSVVIAERALARMVQDFRRHGKTKKALVGAGTIIVHEQIHVLQRCFPRKFAGLYTGVFGLLDGKVERDEWVEQNEIQNPDGLEGNRWVVVHEGNYYWLKTVLDEMDDPAKMPGSFREAVMGLQKEGDSFRVVWKKVEKKPQLLDPGVLSNWKKQFPIRTGHDHPNEIFAYLFQAELTRKIEGEEPAGDPITQKTMEWARKELK
jgi:hypothetical protein